MPNVLQAGIEKLKIKGRAQVTFNPLIQHLPVIAAVKVYAFISFRRNVGPESTPSLYVSAHLLMFCLTAVLS